VNLYKIRTFDEEIVRCTELGGVEGICTKLKVDVKIGLTGEDFPERTQQFGNNYREPIKAKAWHTLFLAALDDFMLKVLIFAAIFSIVFDMLLASPEDRGHAWIEGFAIMVAVALVATVGSFVDWKKEVQFVKSRLKSDEKNVCRVLRGGELIEIHHNFLHVGDVINVEYGMANPIDGLILQATQLAVDESAMTGESDEMKKEILYFCNLRREEKNAEQN
jgi:magnesium-transporting ATPase (P-type)